MLRYQAKRQSSSYVCASCRRQYKQDLAQLRSTDRIRFTHLFSTVRTLSSTSTTVSKLPTSQGQRDRSTHHDVLSKRTPRIDARGYANWGKFGSQSIPGQSNPAWGASSKNNQSAGTPSPSPAWGGATKIPPATGTSAWAGAGSLPSTTATPAETEGANSIPPASGSTAWGGAAPRPLTPATPAWSGGGSSIPSATGSTAWGGAGKTPSGSAMAAWSREANSTPTATGSSAWGGAGKTPTGSTHKAPAPARDSGEVNAAATSSGSVSGQPHDTTWGNGASGAVPAPSDGSDGKPMWGAAPGRRGIAAWASGNSTLGGSSAWTPRENTSSHSSIPAKEASADSGTAPAKWTSGLDASTWKQRDNTGPSPASVTTRNAVSQRSSGSRTAELILDTVFTKPPIHRPPPGAEFPQLRRRSSRDDMFESMSPFKLPSRQDWERNKIPSPGSLQNAITRERPSQPPERKDRRAGQLPRNHKDWSISTMPEMSTQFKKPFPETTERGHSDLSTLSKSEDQFDLMQKNVVLEQKRINSFDQKAWDEGPIATESRQPSRPATDQDTALHDSRRRERDSGTDVAVRGRGRGSDREIKNYRGRGRGVAHSSDLDDSVYATRDKANKRRKFGGNRKQNTDDDEIDEDFDSYAEAKAMRKQRQRRLEEKRAAEEAAAPKTILLPEYITVYDLAEALRIKPANFLHDLEQLGFENTLQDSVMTGETAALVAAEYGFEPTVESGANIDLRPRPPPEDLASVPPRPPIVTIMGHVDHGKTTILDTLRKSSIVAQEFGGITQHIGAFSVKLSLGKTISFLDTPGHAAFLSMRQRGANVTDIVVLVVAVDDSVKPQTIEAIKHAQSAKVPMIVAINKIDIDDTPNRIDKVKQDLANHGVEIEDYGGDVQAVAISGRTGRGMRDLEDAILTLSEVLDMRAEIDGMAEGWVLEASIKPDGRAATILVKRGTLRIGDLIVAGTAYTKVRIMRNEAGVDIEAAGPGTPVEIYGSWKGEPVAGDMVLQAPDETKAQMAVDYRQEIAERSVAAAQNAERQAQDREKAEREALKKQLEEAEEAGESADAESIAVGPKVVSIIIRGDVMGSVEAASMAIQEIGNNEVRPRILRASPGQITESDVDHMATAKGAIVNFNTTTPSHVSMRADKAGVVILNHNIIYETVQAVKDLLSAQLTPIYNQRVMAEAQVANIFSINVTKRKYKNIAGVKVTNGKVTRGGQYRVMRDGEEVYKGKLVALKQNKDDVTEVRNGIECGMMFDEYDDFRVGDLIQLYEDVEQKRYL